MNDRQVSDLITNFYNFIKILELSKKDELIREKQKYEELIADSNKRVETWLERAEKFFDFAATAKQRFENDSLEDKREVLSFLGSNLTFINRILQSPVDKNLVVFHALSKEVKSLHNRLEPIQTIGSYTDWEALYSTNNKMRG